jgi:hypothetical protein
MAAPTKAAHVKKALANQEPSTHGTLRKAVDRAEHLSVTSVFKFSINASDFALRREWLGAGVKTTFGPRRYRLLNP